MKWSEKKMRERNSMGEAVRAAAPYVSNSISTKETSD
jgi:hypothetical protein